jgi:hypothetical protein
MPDLDMSLSPHLGHVPYIGVSSGAEMVPAAVGSKKATVPPDAFLTGEHDDPQ